MNTDLLPVFRLAAAGTGCGFNAALSEHAPLGAFAGRYGAMPVDSPAIEQAADGRAALLCRLGID